MKPSVSKVTNRGYRYYNVCHVKSLMDSTYAALQVIIWKTEESLQQMFVSLVSPFEGPCYKTNTSRSREANSIFLSWTNSCQPLRRWAAQGDSGAMNTEEVPFDYKDPGPEKPTSSSLIQQAETQSGPHSLGDWSGCSAEDRELAFRNLFLYSRS